MSLPVTKGELNRLGDRLIESQEPSESDLVELAPVLAYYQDVLERVKAHLSDLGFAPTGRVKTTTTMLDKLRRTHRRFDAPGIALSARFEAEREFRDQPDVEVVVLGADSWDALKHTHARYFSSVQELARAALERLA